MLIAMIKKGAVDKAIELRIIDSTDGTPETGVVWNTSGIDLWYRREGAAKVSITEATLSALTDAHSDGGFLHISDGIYRFDLPDAAFATGANFVYIGGTVTGMIVIGGRVQLIDFDPNDTVRLGLTALPSAAAEAAGGLYTRGSGAGQINQNANGQIDSRAVAILNGIIAAATFAANALDAVWSTATRLLTAGTNIALAKGTGVTGFNDLSAAQVNTEVDTALVARNLDKLVLLSGTADSGSTTTLVDSALTQADADWWKGRMLVFTSGTLLGQCAVITDFNAATDTLTFAPPVTVAVSTHTYVILPGVSVWDDTMAEHLIAGSTGEKLNAAGAAGDPWSTALPGAYGAGTAGKIVGDNVNATISSRSSQTSVDTVDDFLDTEISAIKTKTDQLTFTIANKVDSSIQAAGDFAQAAADKVWATAARTLTAFSFTVALTAGGIQAIWDALTSALTTASSVGKLLVDNLNATITSRMATFTLPTNFSALLIEGGGNVKVANGIKKGVALNNLEFKMKLTSDHLSPATGLIFSAGKAQSSINGGAFANLTNLPTEISVGFYKINLAATDLNGDIITLRFTGTAADPTEITILTTP